MNEFSNFLSEQPQEPEMIKHDEGDLLTSEHNKKSLSRRGMLKLGTVIAAGQAAKYLQPYALNNMEVTRFTNSTTRRNLLATGAAYATAAVGFFRTKNLARLSYKGETKEVAEKAARTLLEGVPAKGLALRSMSIIYESIGSVSLEMREVLYFFDRFKREFEEKENMRTVIEQYAVAFDMAWRAKLAKSQQSSGG